MKTPRNRPLSVTLIGWLFVAAGVVGLVYHAGEFRSQGAFQYDLVWVSLVRLLAIVGGVFLLRGRNGARWLVTAWMAYHVVLSAFHSPAELAVHAVLLAVITYFLFRRPASNFFRGAGPA